MTLLIIDTSIYLHKGFDGKDTRDHVKRFWFNYDHLRKVAGPQVKEVIWCLDSDTPTFRHIQYPPYKAQRSEKTQEFKDFKTSIEADLMKRHKAIIKEGWEADDLIFTIAKQYKGKVIIASTDLDQSQTVSRNIMMYKLNNEHAYENVTPEYVVRRYGILPWQIPHYKALSGDKSDNIKLRVRGLGPLAAATLLILYGSLDGIYKVIEETPEEFH